MPTRNVLMCLPYVEGKERFTWLIELFLLELFIIKVRFLYYQ